MATGSEHDKSHINSSVAPVEEGAVDNGGIAIL